MTAERGEATIALAIAGAIATGAPLLVAASGAEASLYRIASVVIALTAIGTGVAVLWRGFRSAARKLDGIERTVTALAELQEQVNRIEARQIGTQSQTQDNSRRLHLIDGLEPS